MMLTLGTTIAQIAEQCLQQRGNFTPIRILKEKLSEQNSFVITPHHQNYILPFTHNDSPNQESLDTQGSHERIESLIDYDHRVQRLGLGLLLTDLL